MPQDVAHLVTAARDGDREAFDELVRATYAETFTLALRLTGNEEDARDVVQEAYIRAFRGLEPLPRRRAVLHVDVPHHRQLRQHAPRPSATSTATRCSTTPTPSPTTDPPSDPQLQADATALRHRLTDALEDLPPKLRQVVVLRDIYDLPHEAIAAELGISETAAKVRLHRARKKLREDLFPRRVEEAADAV